MTSHGHHVTQTHAVPEHHEEPHDVVAWVPHATADLAEASAWSASIDA